MKKNIIFKIVFILVMSMPVYISCGNAQDITDPIVTIETPQDNDTIYGACGVDFILRATGVDDVTENMVFSVYIKSVTVSEFTFLFQTFNYMLEINSQNASDEEGYFFDTRDYENGDYNLKVIAEDASGNQGSDEIIVHILN